MDGGGGELSPGRSSQARSPSSPERQGRHRSRYRELRGGGRSRDHSPLRADREEGELSPSATSDPTQSTGGSRAQ